MSARKRMQVYEVPVSILDKRVMTVKAYSATEARERALNGHYVRLGPSVGRGILIAEEASGPFEES